MSSSTVMTDVPDWTAVVLLHAEQLCHEVISSLPWEQGGGYQSWISLCMTCKAVQPLLTLLPGLALSLSDATVTATHCISQPARPVDFGPALRLLSTTGNLKYILMKRVPVEYVSFVLQTLAAMKPTLQKLSIQVVPNTAYPLLRLAALP